jgi:hypothetical protein
MRSYKEEGPAEILPAIYEKKFMSTRLGSLDLPDLKDFVYVFVSLMYDIIITFTYV